MTGALAIVAAVMLTDTAPALFWQDPGGLLPASVATCGTYRVSTDYMGEYYGVLSAMWEREIVFGWRGDALESSAIESTDSFPTNNIGYQSPVELFMWSPGSIYDGWKKVPDLNTNRVCRTRRLVDARYLDMANWTLEEIVASGATSSLCVTNDLPTITWTSDPWAAMTNAYWPGIVAAPAYKSGDDNGIFERMMGFATTNSFVDVPALVDAWTNAVAPPTLMQLLALQMQGITNTVPIVGFSEWTVDPLLSPITGEPNGIIWGDPFGEGFDQWYFSIDGGGPLPSGNTDTNATSVSGYGFSGTRTKGYRIIDSASLLTNNTLRVDRGRLSALEYAASLFDRDYTFGSASLLALDLSYAHTLEAESVAQGVLTTTPTNGDEYVFSAVEFNGPNWGASTDTLTVSTNSVGRSSVAYDLTAGTIRWSGAALTATGRVNIPKASIQGLVDQIHGSYGDDVETVYFDSTFLRPTQRPNIFKWEMVEVSTSNATYSVDLDIEVGTVTCSVRRVAAAHHDASAVKYTAAFTNSLASVQTKPWQWGWVTNAVTWTEDSEMSVVEVPGATFNAFEWQNILSYGAANTNAVRSYRHRLSSRGSQNTFSQYLSALAGAAIESANAANSAMTSLSGYLLDPPGYVDIQASALNAAKSRAEQLSSRQQTASAFDVTIGVAGNVASTYSAATPDGTISGPVTSAGVPGFDLGVEVWDPLTNTTGRAAAGVFRSSAPVTRRAWKFPNCRPF